MLKCLMFLHYCCFLCGSGRRQPGDAALVVAPRKADRACVCVCVCVCVSCYSRSPWPTLTSGCSFHKGLAKSGLNVRETQRFAFIGNISRPQHDAAGCLLPTLQRATLDTPTPHPHHLPPRPPNYCQAWTR